MKLSRLKMTGFALLFFTALVALCLQVFGLGLITTRPSTTPPREAITYQGTTVTVVTGSATIFHLTRIVPLAAIAIAGLVCVILSKRDEIYVG